MPRRVLIGTVVSNKMEKSVTVQVDRRVKHPLYKKFMTQSKKIAAHVDTNSLEIGEQVRIRECRPISKSKRFEVIEKVDA